MFEFNLQVRVQIDQREVNEPDRSLASYTIFVLISVGYDLEFRILLRVRRFLTQLTLVVSMHTEAYDITWLV